MKILIRENYIDTETLKSGRFGASAEQILTVSPYNFRIVEIPNECNDCVYQDFDDFVFSLAKYNARKSKQQIPSLKAELEKAKEDVEQVELFGMVRADYEIKKARCKEIILQLRELEK